MAIEIKQLKQNGVIFVPQTVAEAVLVKTQDNSNIVTLDTVLKNQIQQVSNSDKSLIITKNGNNLDINHTNTITAISTATPLQVAYDSNGHITNSIPLNKLIITANGEQVLQHDGSVEQQVNFGDDFQKNEQNLITLRWNNYGNS